MQKEGDLSEGLETDPQAATSERDGQSIKGLCELMQEMQSKQEEMYLHVLQGQDRIVSELQEVK